jgi:hypothetical protein
LVDVATAIRVKCANLAKLGKIGLAVGFCSLLGGPRQRAM